MVEAPEIHQTKNHMKRFFTRLLYAYRNMAIPTDAPKVGDRITITRWLNHADKSWVGDVLIVQSVCLPCITVKNVSSRYNFGVMPLSLDNVEVAHLSKEYVETLTETLTKPKP